MVVLGAPIGATASHSEFKDKHAYFEVTVDTRAKRLECDVSGFSKKKADPTVDEVEGLPEPFLGGGAILLRSKSVGKSRGGSGAGSGGVC